MQPFRPSLRTRRPPLFAQTALNDRQSKPATLAEVEVGARCTARGRLTDAHGFPFPSSCLAVVASPFRVRVGSEWRNVPALPTTGGLFSFRYVW